MTFRLKTSEDHDCRYQRKRQIYIKDGAFAFSRKAAHELAKLKFV